MIVDRRRPREPRHYDWSIDPARDATISGAPPAASQSTGDTGESWKLRRCDRPSRRRVTVPAMADGQAQAQPSAGTRALHRERLDGEELDRLQALKAATSEQAADYLAILAVLVDLKGRYEIQVRTERLAAELVAAGRDPSNLAAQLAQLQAWGNVTWTQDTNRVNRIEDFKRRRELWQLTAAGQAAHDAALAVLRAAEHTGSLQRTLFRELREHLDALGAAVDTGDAAAVYLRLRDLDAALRDLAANARDFHARIAELRREQEVDPERFLAYKAMLIDYLQEFLDDLARWRVVIGRQVVAVEERGLDRMVALAAAGDDSRNIFGDDDLEARWRARWSGLRHWFVAGDAANGARARDRTGAEQLAEATTVAIRSLMALLRRLTESANRPITRASEMLVLARWFQRCDTREADELFDAAFGLGRLVHLNTSEIDPDVVPSTTSWWDAPAVDVPVTLRSYGRIAAPGRAGPAVDFSTQKRLLAEAHEHARVQRADAARRLVARRLAGRVISDGELDFLLELLDRAVHRRDPTAARPTGDPAILDAAAEGARLVLHPKPGEAFAVHATRGVLTVDGYALAVEPA